MQEKKRFFTIRNLIYIVLFLLAIFFCLGFFGFFSMNNLAIIVKQNEPSRKPLALLFVGIVLLTFVIVCFIHKKNHKK